MTDLSYPLSLLSRAVSFKNLSSASLHVGLSQPQLSRLISRLEKELGMELLDRKVKRKSNWTPQAIQLAELFTQNQRKLESSIRALQTDQRTRQLHIGTLEGLAEVAIRLGHDLFHKGGLNLISIDVFDRSELEGKFLSGDLDLILNTRFPSPTKPRFAKVIGYQSLERVDSNKEYSLYSSFEFNIGSRKRGIKESEKVVVSNSLHVRQLWFENFGGTGSLPSRLVEKSKKDFAEVYLIGADWLETRLWDAL